MGEVSFFDVLHSMCVEEKVTGTSAQQTHLVIDGQRYMQRL